MVYDRLVDYKICYYVDHTFLDVLLSYSWQPYVRASDDMTRPYDDNKLRSQDSDDRNDHVAEAPDHPPWCLLGSILGFKYVHTAQLHTHSVHRGMSTHTYIHE